MAHTTKSKTESAKAIGPLETIYAYAVEGDPVKALAGMDLPDGASVAILTRRPTADQRINQLRAMRLYNEVAKAKSGVTAALVEAKQAVVDTSAFRPDARSRALLRGVRLAEEDLKAAGGAYDLAEVRTLLHGISRQAVEKRVREGTLLAVPGPSNRRSYPTVQFTADGAVVEGLKEVLEALPTQNPWAALNFLVNPDSRLDERKPIELLKAGEIGAVVEASRRVGVQGA